MGFLDPVARPAVLALHHIGKAPELASRGSPPDVSPAEHPKVEGCDHDLMDDRERSRAPVAVMQAMVEAFDTGEVHDLADIVDPEYLDHQGLPHVRPIRGADGFRQVVEAARSGYEDLSVQIMDVIEGEDRVAARLLWSGVRRNGLSAERETLEIVRVRDGRAVEHWGGHS